MRPRAKQQTPADLLQSQNKELSKSTPHPHACIREPYICGPTTFLPNPSDYIVLHCDYILRKVQSRLRTHKSNTATICREHVSRPEGIYNGSSVAVDMQKIFAKTPLAARIHCGLGVSLVYGSGACSQASSRLPSRAVEAAAALFGLLLVLLAHISREKNLQCMEY